MWLEVILSLIFLWALWETCKKPKGLPPGPWGFPFVGNLYTTLIPRQPKVEEMRKKYGNIFIARVGTTVNVYVCDQDLIKEVCTRQEFLDRPEWEIYNFMSGTPGLGITCSNGLLWQTNRRFSVRQLKDLGMGKSYMTDAIELEAQMMVKEFEKAAGGLTDLGYFMNVAVTNIIWQLVAGQRYDIDSEEIKSLNRLITEFQESYGILMTFNFLPWLTKIVPSWVKNRLFQKTMIKIKKNFTKYINVICDDHKATLDPENPRDYIDAFLVEKENHKDKSDSTFNDETLVSVLWDLFIAGTDTVALTLRWFILYMCQYPEVQRKVQEEIDDVLPDKRQPSWEDKKKMPYTEAVIHEVHRIISLVPFVLHRIATKDTLLGGYRIPKGAVLYPCVYSSHTNTEFWDKPSEFRPERFLNANNEFMIPRNGFMVFGVGRRSCVGEVLARMEMFIIVTSLLQKLEFSSGPDGVCLEPRNTHIVNMSRPQALRVDLRE
ncbi:cytochrome P450 2L1-like [Oratosquilla oratoria]|uniref:cytochrome P450 2L1-like n=1 Tax=Oratosquilla oratoria TaxID=337810 RepID=UPI003F7578FA